MNFDVDLAGLQLQDDLNIGDFGVDDPGQYQDQTQPAPPREDNYELRVTGFRQATVFGSQTEAAYDKDDQGRQWPVFEITEVEILRPSELARKVRMNQKIKTRPFARQGAAGESLASEFADLLRSFDAQRAWSGIVGDGSNGVPSGLTLLKEFMETGATAKGRGQWRAYDKTYADNAIAALGGDANVSKEDRGRIIQKASIRGMSKFPQNSKGGHIPEVLGPSGEKLNAKFVIARFYPSNDAKVKIKD